ncbi:cytosolic purine 5'-nucleotidase [Planoprotostelium fungivorum]|uniref:Cytosolic purine 5'-nucleotidase n=1 Tax=Planoprotostelium fungivorum TaxID=1890364 RepID=A0A2P6NUN0_9EUKA|nr:cytosolic purine 5'-nucleotidase [Planoprotostelium fungivorum]
MQHKRGSRDLQDNFAPDSPSIQKFLDKPSPSTSTYKRDILSYRSNFHRIFVNRDLRLDKIKWIGFDMDYTLASYNSPAYESLTYDLITEQLIKMGYPHQLSSMSYDPEFPVRGIYFDKVLGHLIKVDSFGSIVRCLHGRRTLTKQEISELYPSFTVPTQDIEKRYWPLPTLFNLPEACLYANLIDYFFNRDEKRLLRQSREDVSFEGSGPTITNLFQDVRLAMDHVHLTGLLKERTLADKEKYIKRTPDTAVLLDRLQKAGIKAFLLTNSEFYYTHAVMSYLLEGHGDGVSLNKSWRDFFTVIIVSAGKPSFFSQGTTLREVDIITGNLMISKIEKFNQGHVYQGGSIGLFNSLTGIKGNEVLYVGDHIYADIIKSKKIHAWRTLLVIPELEKELNVWQECTALVQQLRKLEWMKAEVFRNLTSEDTQPPDTTDIRKHKKVVVERIDHSYNSYFGSLFSSGSKNTWFASQVMRYADLYSYDYLNLLNYPLFYHFTAQYQNMPHVQEEK